MRFYERAEMERIGPILVMKRPYFQEFFSFFLYSYFVMNENNVTEVSYYCITDCLSIIRSQRMYQFEPFFYLEINQMLYL